MKVKELKDNDIFIFVNKNPGVVHKVVKVFEKLYLQNLEDDEDHIKLFEEYEDEEVCLVKLLERGGEIAGFSYR